MQSAQRPTHVTIVPFAAPPGDAKTGFVVAYHPWSGSVEGVTGSQLLRDAKVSCGNMHCTYNAESRAIALEEPPAGVDHVEVVVEKDGFEPLRFDVPLAMRDSYPTVVVVLTSKGAGAAP